MQKRWKSLCVNTFYAIKKEPMLKKAIDQTLLDEMDLVNKRETFHVHQVRNCSIFMERFITPYHLIREHRNTI